MKDVRKNRVFRQLQKFNPIATERVIFTDPRMRVCFFSDQKDVVYYPRLFNFFRTL